MGDKYGVGLGIGVTGDPVIILGSADILADQAVGDGHAGRIFERDDVTHVVCQARSDKNYAADRQGRVHGAGGDDKRTDTEDRNFGRNGGEDHDKQKRE